MTRAFQKPLGVLAYYNNGKFGKDRISVIPVLFFSFNSITSVEPLHYHGALTIEIKFIKNG